MLPASISTQIFAALLENAASEQGARMSAMDNATRNAGEMIDKLTIEFNRSRQAVITSELIEIISGAEAL
jgi:F-type H+-transporting ATPase subunit gamma